MTAPSLSRRDWLRLSAAGVAFSSLSGWLGSLATAAAAHPARKRSCILLWMNGGPSQMDTFDLKPGHKNGGAAKEIATSVPGIKISENLPGLAKRMKHLAILRSMTTREADHSRATYLMHTGRVPGGPIQYPALGALVAHALDRRGAELPGFVSIAPFRLFGAAAFGSGFLGPRFAPLVVGENASYGPQGAGRPEDQLRVQDLETPAAIAPGRHAARVRLLEDMEEDFLSERAGPASLSHHTAYRQAVTLMNSKAVKAFDLGEEKEELRTRYGKNLFGQGCLLARRLVEQGVPFIEVALNGWDTHQNNAAQVKNLSGMLDPAWSTLLDDLEEKGLLDSTLIVWMGEFGRTPKINGNTGRDHWANSWSTVLAGGGIKGGQVIGETSADGLEVKDYPIRTPDLLATVGKALGLDITRQNPSNVGRPIRFVDPGSKPIKEVLA